MKRQLADGLSVRESPINGRGCFATVFFPRGRKIAEYAGEKISRREVARRVRSRKKLRICAINQYWSIDGSRGGNGTHYINHSCAPNSYMKILYGHILFIALRDIHPGEEITLDYVSTYHSNRKRCRCQSPSCRGTINKAVNRES
ncbi:MAG TPA: SET domain-containing protein-lysine N-methyltransferase [Pyrinomonadaceae bacterium]|jgi:SET domain-containing protein|nr:SET domain-containing protein-lysine N-methyltransferase [Pyrinomonadaceae bacterium]